MRIIARSALEHFWRRRPEAEQPLRAWFYEVKRATWETSADVKTQYPSASIISADRVVFNIAGNHFRVVVVIKYKWQTVYVRFIGTHDEYDRIDARTV